MGAQGVESDSESIRGPESESEQHRHDSAPLQITIDSAMTLRFETPLPPHPRYLQTLASKHSPKKMLQLIIKKTRSANDFDLDSNCTITKNTHK